jgi:hypothetical protein
VGACDGCPDYIKAKIERPVSRALRQVKAVKQVINGFTSVVRDFTDELVDSMTVDLDALVIEIPPPPTLDFTDIIGLITCPLLPLALALDPSVLAQLDPQKVIDMIKREMKEYVDKLMAEFEEAKRALPTFPNLRVFDRFFKELKRLRVDTVLIAETTATCLYVQGVCRDYYESGPFAEFMEEVSDFSVTGLIPSGIPDVVTPIMNKLNEAEAKLASWRLFVAL